MPPTDTPIVPGAPPPPQTTQQAPPTEMPITPVATAETTLPVQPVIREAKPLPPTVMEADQIPVKETPVVAQPETQIPVTTVSETDLNPPPVPVDGTCQPRPLQVENATRKLDILFVMDTSASLRGGHNHVVGGELAELARGMKNFIANLDDQTDYRIAVLPAHGPGSPYHGKLWSYNSRDPLVIDYKKYYDREKRRGGSDADVRARVGATVGKILEKKLIAMPVDHTDAQGEAMMLSLYDVITKDSLRNRIIREGFFRKDSHLAIVTMTDEQDVCYDYAGTGFSPRLKTYTDAKTKKTSTQADPHETRFLNEVCKKAGAGGVPLTPALVDQALRDLTNNRFTFTGVIYTNNGNGRDVPVKLGNQDDDEMGHGIFDLIQMSSGRMADLDKVNRSEPFGQELGSFGELAQFNMSFNKSFGCYTNIDPRSIDKSTVELHVYDQDAREIGVFSGSCQQGQDCNGYNGRANVQVLKNGLGGNPYMKVSLNQEAMQKMMSNSSKLDFTKCESKNGKITSMEQPLNQRNCPSVEMKFRTRGGMDTKTGKYIPGYYKKNSSTKKAKEWMKRIKPVEHPSASQAMATSPSASELARTPNIPLTMAANYSKARPQVKEKTTAQRIAEYNARKAKRAHETKVKARVANVKKLKERRAKTQLAQKAGAKPAQAAKPTAIQKPAAQAAKVIDPKQAARDRAQDAKQDAMMERQAKAAQAKAAKQAALDKAQDDRQDAADAKASTQTAKAKTSTTVAPVKKNEPVAQPANGYVPPIKPTPPEATDLLK
jgi:hypothetical protein